MEDQNKNLVLATVLSVLVLVIWFALFPPPEPPVGEAPGQTTEQTTGQAADPVAEGSTGGQTASTPTAAPGHEEVVTTTEPEVEPDTAPRVAIDTPSLDGSISLKGGRIDTLHLKNYRTSLDEDADTVTLLSPVGSAQPYYALYGWAPGAGLSADQVPGANTLWQLKSGTTLDVDAPVTLSWDNGAGLVFERRIEVDDRYMFTIHQSVRNNGTAPISLAPYGILARHGLPKDLKSFFILHEGLVSMSDGSLNETSYEDMTEYDVNQRERARAEVTQVESDGWIGFTDHYWMTTLIPSPGSAFKSVAKYDERRDIYQAEAVLPTLTVEPGGTGAETMQLFAGAKNWQAIRDYEAGYDTAPLGKSLSYGVGLSSAEGIKGFIDSIDWGWFFFITKPIFWLLHNLNQLIGNMGLAIIALTLIIKALMLPLAFKSYVSMARMKELQPEMEKIKERAGDDRQKLQKEMMELYKKEKVNPASGCLPLLLQIPVFFSLYKVIFVTLELRHAPFFGWLRDLSAPDPSSLYNLWGLLPWDAPEPGSILALIFIGILPLLLGISMWLQQKLNPAPTDPTQKMIFAWMPWVFMFMLGSFASGLVVYWIANNTITFTQQYLIMRSQGYTPDVFGNIKSGFKRTPQTAAKEAAKAKAAQAAANQKSAPKGKPGSPGSKKK